MSVYLVLNFRDPAPPSPRGMLANATPRRFPFRLMTRNLSSGIWPSAFSSFSKSALNAASASIIASNDFFTAAGRSSASMFCHFNSSFAIALVHLASRFLRYPAYGANLRDALPAFCPLDPNIGVEGIRMGRLAEIERAVAAVARLLLNPTPVPSTCRHVFQHNRFAKCGSPAATGPVHATGSGQLSGRVARGSYIPKNFAIPAVAARASAIISFEDAHHDPTRPHQQHAIIGLE